MTDARWLLRSALTELGPCRFAAMLAACPVIVAVAWGMVAVALEAAPDRDPPPSARSIDGETEDKGNG